MLNGQTALIVEDEFLIALDLQRMLEILGAGKTLFARSAAEAEQLWAQGPDLALAVVEICNHHMPTLTLVESLIAAGIPTVLIAAEPAACEGMGPLPDLPILVKPVPEEGLASAIREALAKAR